MKEKVAPAIPEELEGLHVYLSQDLWSRNDHWSAFQEWKTLQTHVANKTTAPLDVHRWVFGSSEPENLLSEAVKAETPPASTKGPNIADSNEPAKQNAPEQNVSEHNLPRQTSPPSDKQTAETATQKQEHWSFNALQDFFIRTDSKNLETDSSQYSEKFAKLKLLSEQDSLAGWNAAILWATLSPETAIETIPILEKLAFEQITSDPPKKKNTPAQPKPLPLSPAMRHAAINGISLVLSHADAIPLDTKNKLTQALQRPDISMEIRYELFCGLARFMSPANIPTLEQSLDVGDNQRRLPKTLRRAAMDACIIHGLWFYADQNRFSIPGHSQKESRLFEPAVWPTNITQVRWDSDSLMRTNFGYWAALVRHPDAEAILTSQLKDADLQVQNEALKHLGILGTETALQQLKEQAKRPQESSRISAAVGLTPWGAQYLAPLSKDTAASVRLAATKGLGQVASPEAALLLRSLLNDRSTHVQIAVIDSISQWPDELAIPLLLEGIQEGVYKTRRKSIIQLTNRTGMGGSISIEAPKADRIAAVRKLIQSEQVPGALWNQLLQSGLQKPREVNQSRAAEIQAYFQDLINQPRESTQYQQAFQELENISSNELEILEKLILETSIELPKEIYTELLPGLESNYAALNQLSSSHVTDRRKGAQQLLLNSQNVSLNPVLIKRLRKLMTHEQDRLVWRIVMSAISKDNYDESAQLALLAINHNWSDIRILGCEYFGKHGLPQYAAWLLPLLNDKNESVQLAAMHALGQCHNPIAITGIQNTAQNQPPAPSLKSKLTHSNHRVRFEAVAALSRLGDIEGMQELVRLSNDTNNSIRSDAVREMGDSGQTRYVEPLIQMAWTERNHSTLKEILSSLDKLVPDSEQPAELASQLKHFEQAKIWMNWWQTHHSGPSARLFTGS
ncbi:HEAT repeat domain-containing protein [uncultured Gimesia sp.]|uniref:HEAT repeat domain-containing protein n=1 Tax=uncultured Gimesia sp. TaxID=1678688 RepID=UPI0030DD07C0|tara:strand:- start:286436 stop:289162 length:2727 start_codon:yes stop_codon:yes gene_type:complete